MRAAPRTPAVCDDVILKLFVVCQPLSTICAAVQAGGGRKHRRQAEPMIDVFKTIGRDGRPKKRKVRHVVHSSAVGREGLETSSDRACDHLSIAAHRPILHLTNPSIFLHLTNPSLADTWAPDGGPLPGR